MLSRGVDDGCLSPTCPIWYAPPLERREGEERPMAPSMAPRCLVSRGLHRLASLRAKSHARVSACVYRIIIDVTASTRAGAGEAPAVAGAGSRSERSGPRHREVGSGKRNAARPARAGAGAARSSFDSRHPKYRLTASSIVSTSVRCPVVQSYTFGERALPTTRYPPAPAAAPGDSRSSPSRAGRTVSDPGRGPPGLLITGYVKTWGLDKYHFNSHFPPQGRV